MIKSFSKILNYPIPDELRPYIVHVILGESEGPVNVTYPVVPIGYPFFVYVYDDIPILHVDNLTFQPDSRLNVSGQMHNVDVNMEINGQFGQIGFVLHPSAPYYLFYKPGEFFLNKSRDFKEASPLDTRTLIKTLGACDNPTKRIELMMDFMKELARHRLPPIGWLDHVLIEIYRNNGKIDQKKLAQKVGIGERHLRRKFKEVIGLPPKYFCKVLQLNTVFELLKAPDSGKLHDLALDCGYYDQAHFINDFKRLIGNNPGDFLQGSYASVKTYLGRRS